MCYYLPALYFRRTAKTILLGKVLQIGRTCAYTEAILRKGQAHPAAEVSKNLISEALIGLMGRKEYRDITITEVCGSARVARRTFYRNFSRLDDVLAFHSRRVAEAFAEEMLRHAGRAYESVLTRYFEFWRGHADFAMLLNRGGLSHLLFSEYIRCLDRIPFVFSPGRALPRDPGDIPVVVSFQAGGLWSVLTYWMYTGCEKSPATLAGIVADRILASDGRK